MIDTVTGEITEFHERQRAFALDDVVSVLGRAGFVGIARYGDMQGKPATAERFGVFVCHR